MTHDSIRIVVYCVMCMRILYILKFIFSYLKLYVLVRFKMLVPFKKTQPLGYKLIIVILKYLITTKRHILEFLLKEKLES